MAGDWIPMRCNLAQEPEVIAVAAATNIDEDAVVGKLHRLWSWANQHTTDGNARSVTYFWINRFLSCEGFAEALEEQGWLSVGKAGVRFPKFDRFNSQGAKRRVLTAKRVAEHKSKKGNARSVSDALPKEENRRVYIYPLPPLFLGTRVEQLWADFNQHRRQKKAALTETAAARAVKNLESWGVERAIAALEHSLAQGYTGLFEPGESRGQSKPKRGPELDPAKAQRWTPGG